MLMTDYYDAIIILNILEFVFFCSIIIDVCTN